MSHPPQPEEARFLQELEASTHADIRIPADAHLVGERVTATQIRYLGLARVGLLATLQKVLSLELRCLEAHALLGERHRSGWPSLALQHFELEASR